MVYAYKKFRYYLLSYKVIFYIDHNPLKYLMNKADLSRRIARWIILLHEFNYEMQYKTRRSNANVDFISRLKGIASLESLIEHFPLEFLDDLEIKTSEGDKKE